MGKIVKLGEEWILYTKFLTEMIEVIYEKCNIDKRKEIIIKIISGEHVSIKIKGNE